MTPLAFGHVIAGPPVPRAGGGGAWSGDGLAIALVALAAAAVAATWLVDRSHPRNRVPQRRLLALLLGLGAVGVALLSPVDGLADDAYSWHMVQHLLLTFVAAPLVVLGAPITLVLRASPGGVRRRVLLPVLHSAPVRAIGHPAVGWLALVVVSWAVHLSPLYPAALEDQSVHELEHGLLLAAGLLFWAPVVGADPVPWRLDHGSRFALVALALPLLSLLGVVIYSAPAPLWADYVARATAIGADPMADQRLAGAIMWAGGDLLLLAGLGVVTGDAFLTHRRRATPSERAPDGAADRAARLAGRPT